MCARARTCTCMYMRVCILQVRMHAHLPVFDDIRFGGSFCIKGFYFIFIHISFKHFFHFCTIL